MFNKKNYQKPRQRHARPASRSFPAKKPTGDFGNRSFESKDRREGGGSGRASSSGWKPRSSSGKGKGYASDFGNRSFESRDRGEGRDSGRASSSGWKPRSSSGKGYAGDFGNRSFESKDRGEGRGSGRASSSDRKPRSSSGKGYAGDFGNRSFESKDRREGRDSGRVFSSDRKPRSSSGKGKGYAGDFGNRSFESKGRGEDRRPDREKNRVDSPDPKPYLLLGIRPLEEAIRRKVKFHRLYLQKQEERNFEVFIQYCKEYKLPFFFVEKNELDEKSGGQNHQGVVAELMRDTRLIPDLKEYLEKHPSHGEVVLILDRITDQQNVGAIARSAYFFGCQLIISERSHSAPIDAVVHKTSSGASLMVSFHLAKSMTETLNTLKAAGFEILAATSGEAIPINQLDKIDSDGDRPVKNCALILGSEGKGIRPHLAGMADRKITIPHLNDFDSLNVSVATGIILYALSEIGMIGTKSEVEEEETIDEEG